MQDGSRSGPLRAGEAGAPASGGGQGGGGGGDPSLDVSDLFATLARGKWIVVATALLVAGAVAGYTYMQPAVYEATSIVRVDPERPTSLNLSPTRRDEPTRTAQGELGTLRNSLELARRVAAALRTTETADGEGRTFPILSAGPEEESRGRAARRILDATTFERGQEDPSLIRIVVESRVPEEASTLATLYAETYRTFGRERARSGLEAARQFLERQAEKQRAKIRKFERQLESFARRNRLPAQGEEGERLAQEYQRLKTRRDELAFELEREQTRLGLLRQQLKQFRPQLRENVLEEQEASGLRSEIRALGEQITQMRVEAAQYYAANPALEGDTTRIRAEFPELARLTQRIEALRERQRTRVQQLIDETTARRPAEAPGVSLDRVSALRGRIVDQEITVEQLQAQVAALDSQITAYEPRLDAIPRQRIRRQQIERRLQQAESFYQTIMSELQAASVAEEAELGYVEVVKRAFVPRVPVRPSTTQNLVLGLLLGIGFGVGLAFLYEAASTQLRHPRDIEKQGHTLLGVVPDMEAEVERAFGGRDRVEVEGHTVSTRLMPLLNPWSSITEHYRLLWNSVVQRVGTGEQGGGGLLVTSAQAGEGKTTTAANLALAGALSGQRVLLIDADLRSPTLHTVLGLPRTPGLAEIFEALEGMVGAGRQAQRSPEGGVAVGPHRPGESSIHRAPLDGLHVIPAGQPQEAPAKALDPQHLRRFVEVVQERFDLVILDTPATQAASDAVVMGGQTDAQVLFVSTSASRREAFGAAVRSFQSVGTPVAGVVFNRFDTQAAQSARVPPLSEAGR